MKLKKKALAVMLGAMAFMMVASGCGKAKIGYLDGERVMKEAPQVAAIVTEGNSKLADSRKEIEADLAQKKSSQSESDYQKSQMEAQTKLMAVQQQYSAQMKQKVDAAVAEIVKDKKLDVVVDSEETSKTVIQGGDDITDEVIKKLQ